MEKVNLAYWLYTAERRKDLASVRSAMHRQTMAEFIKELKGFETNPYDDMIERFVTLYTEGANLPEEMWADFGPLFFDSADFIPPQLWLGSVPTHIPTSSLHRDPLTGFLLQVIGKKTAGSLFSGSSRSDLPNEELQ